MSEHDTSPLTEDQVPLEEAYPDLYQKPDLDYPAEKQAYLQKWGPIAEQQFLAEQEQSQKAWNDLVNHPLVQAFKEAAKPKPHEHGPFTFLFNQNHNALRGCQSCGQTWVGSMAGAEDDLRWHPVAEPEEEE